MQPALKAPPTPIEYEIQQLKEENDLHHDILRMERAGSDLENQLFRSAQNNSHGLTTLKPKSISSFLKPVLKPGNAVKPLFDDQIVLP